MREVGRNVSGEREAGTNWHARERHVKREEEEEVTTRRRGVKRNK